MKGSRKFTRSWGEAKWLRGHVAIDRSLGNLHVQVMHILTNGIYRREIPAGARMPSSRAVAEALNVSRNTAKLAFDGLVEQGILVVKDRSGTYVAPIRERASKDPSADQSDQGGMIDWSKRFSLRLKPETDLSSSIVLRTSFLYGQFDASVFPISRWRECERAALSVTDVEAWGKNVVDEDDPMLLEQLRQHVLPRHGIIARSENILITLGGQQGRYLVSQLLGGAGTTTGIEHPGMPDMAEILALSPTRRRVLKLDDEGVVLGDQLRGCDTVFLTCGHQCPTTAVMPSHRREALLAQAEKDDFVVVEDTFETELFAEPEHLPALKSLPDARRVIHVASLSKLIAPGLRIGYVIADAPVIAQMRALRRLIHRHPPGNNQRALAIFIERGHYRAFLRRARSVMAEREKAMIAALRMYMPQAEWRHCTGASTFWVRLPDGVDSRNVAMEAARRGLLVEPGARYFFNGVCEREFLRLSVSSIPAPQIADGILRLAEVVAST